MASIAANPTTSKSPEELRKQQEQQEASLKAVKAQASQPTSGSASVATKDDYQSHPLETAKNENASTTTEAALNTPEGTTGVTVSPSMPQASLAESAVAINSLEAGEALLAKGDWRKGIPKLNEALRNLDVGEKGYAQARLLKTQAHLLQLSQATNPNRRQQVIAAINAQKQHLDPSLQAKIDVLVKDLKRSDTTALNGLADLDAYAQELAGKKLKALMGRWGVRARMQIKKHGLDVQPELLMQDKQFAKEAKDLQAIAPALDEQKLKDLVARTIQGQKIKFIMRSNGPEAWDKARTELEKIDAFDIMPEPALKAHFIQNKLESTLNKAQDARARVGYFMEPARREGIPAAQKEFDKAKSDYMQATEDFIAVNNLLDKKSRLDLEDIKERLHKVSKPAVLAGQEAWLTYKADFEKNAQQEAQNRSTGQKTVDILKGGVGALNHTIESGLLLTIGNLGRAEQVERIRKFFNENAMGGSLLGGDAEFANMQGDLESLEGFGTLFKENAMKINPLVQASDAVFGTAFNLADLSYDEYQKVAAEGGMSWLTGAFAGGSWERELSEAQFRQLQAQNAAFRAGKFSFNVAKGAASMALMGKIGKMSPKDLGRAFGVSAGFGAGGAFAQHLKGDKPFDALRFAENSVAGTANSLMFQAFMSSASTAFGKLRSGNAVEGSARKVAADGQAHLVARAVDATDGLGDLSQALATVDLSSGKTAAGSALQAAMAVFDCVDGKLVTGHLKSSSSASTQAKVDARNIEAPSHKFEYVSSPAMKEQIEGLKTELEALGKATTNTTSEAELARLVEKAVGLENHIQALRGEIDKRKTGRIIEAIRKGENLDIEPTRTVPLRPVTQVAKEYYAQVDAQAMDLETLNKDPNFVKNPLAHPATWPDHGVEHVKNVVRIGQTLIENANGSLIAKREGLRYESMKDLLEMQAWTHDIGMKNLDGTGRLMHPEYAAREVLESEVFGQAINQLWEQNKSPMVQRLKGLEAEGKLPQDGQTILREMMAMAMAHSKSKVAVEVLNDPAQLQEAMREAVGTNMELLTLKSKLKKARTDEQRQTLNDQISNLEAKSGFEAGVKNHPLYGDNARTESFKWLSDPQLKDLVADVQDSARLLRAADAMRQRGGDLRASAGHQIFFDPQSGQAIVALADKKTGAMVNLKSDTSLTIGETLIHSEKLDPVAGTFEFELADIKFGPNKDALHKGAEGVAEVVHDIYKDAVVSFVRAEGNAAKTVDGKDIKIVLRAQKNNMALAQEALNKLIEQAPHLEGTISIGIAEAAAQPTGQETSAMRRYVKGEKVLESASEEKLNAWRASIEATGHLIKSKDNAEVFEGVSRVKLEANTTLVEQGENANFVYVPLHEVKAKGSATSNARTFGLSAYAPFGNTALVRQGTRNATIHSQGEMDMLMVPKSTYQNHWWKPMQVEEYQGFVQGQGNNPSETVKKKVALETTKLSDMRLGERLNHGMHSNVYALGEKQVAVVLKAQDALASEAQSSSKHFRAQIDYMREVNQLEFEGKQIGPKIDHLIHDTKGQVVGYVAERIQGEELATLAQRAKLSDAQFNEVLRQIDGQRQVLHEAGLIHGDPNKSNILVGVDKAGAVKVSLIDFEPANKTFGVTEDAALFTRTIEDVKLLRRPENVRDFLAKEQEQAHAVKTGDFLRTERSHIEALRSELRDVRKTLRASGQETNAVNAMLSTLALEGKETRLWSAEDFKQVGEKLAQDGVLEELQSLGDKGKSLSQKLEKTLARWR